MPSFNRFPVTISKKTKVDVANQALPTEVVEVLVDNKLMCIERMPYNKAFAIFGEQVNSKATYILYLEMDDSFPPQNADITWTMFSETYSGKIKTTMPYAKVVLNRKAECYIQSDNQ
jgi:hypothetical protein